MKRQTIFFCIACDDDDGGGGSGNPAFLLMLGAFGLGRMMDRRKRICS